MKIKRVVEVFVAVLIFVIVLNGAFTDAVELKIPLMGGERGRVDQGNSSTPTHSGSLKYAWDFNIPGTSGDGDMGYPVVAAAGGEIVYAADGGSGWGYCVTIKYEESVYGLHAHLKSIFVKVGQIVKQGQVIGLLGDGTISTNNTENYANYDAHIHYQTQNGVGPNSQSIDPAKTPAKFAEDTADGILDEYQTYTSKNSNIIDIRQSIPHAGKNITDVIGNPEGSISWYYPVANPIANEIDQTGDDKGMSLNVYTQNYPGKSCAINGTSQFCDGAIVYDALGGARSAYLVWYQQFGGYSGNGGWYKPGGPHSAELRNPITNSYWSSKDNCWRQDFQMGWLCYENRRPYDSGDVAPGVYDPWGRIFSDVRRWDAATSYAFAEAYERNGASVNLGSVYDDGGTVFVHNWTINSSTILIQNFSGGNFGPCAIIYNSDAGNAYLVRTGFWEYYKNNGGPPILGPPTEDEHPNLPNQPCSYQACQKFKKGELWWNGNSVVAYIPSVYNTGGNDAPPPSIAPAAPSGLRAQ